jgi:hypothetical protein
VLLLLHFVPCSSVYFCSNCARDLMSHGHTRELEVDSKSFDLPGWTSIVDSLVASWFWASCWLWVARKMNWLQQGQRPNDCIYRCFYCASLVDTKTIDFRNQIRCVNTIWINSKSCLCFLPVTTSNVNKRESCVERLHILWYTPWNTNNCLFF